MKIYVDADACPVKNEVYRVAERYGVDVVVVANSRMSVPCGGRVTLEVVRGGFDEADHWIVDHVAKDDIVVSSDIPLAARCIGRGAHVISPAGRRWTEDNIGDALATRDLLTEIRASGERTGGPPPFGKRDRSKFLSRLDEVIVAVRRKRRAGR